MRLAPAVAAQSLPLPPARVARATAEIGAGGGSSAAPLAPGACDWRPRLQRNHFRFPPRAWPARLRKSVQAVAPARLPSRLAHATGARGCSATTSAAPRRTWPARPARRPGIDGRPRPPARAARAPPKGIFVPGQRPAAAGAPPAACPPLPACAGATAAQRHAVRPPHSARGLPLPWSKYPRGGRPRRGRGGADSPPSAPGRPRGRPPSAERSAGTRGSSR
jgi:hypothetical protein